ncbi:hypothetical protein LBMAG39_03000 [Cyanobium sp.]|nr:hypothetical protein LBMAG39_03000 [Cyanobium sp.]
MEDLQIAIHPGKTAIQLTGTAYLREKGGVADGDGCRPAAIHLLSPEDQALVRPAKQIDGGQEWCLAAIRQGHRLGMQPPRPEH